MPVRTCVGCRRTAEKGALYRFVIREGRLVLDETKSAQGRGAYLHRDRKCLEAAEGGFERSFRRKVRVEADEVWSAWIGNQKEEKES